MIGDMSGVSNYHDHPSLVGSNSCTSINDLEFIERMIVDPLDGGCSRQEWFVYDPEISSDDTSVCSPINETSI